MPRRKRERLTRRADAWLNPVGDGWEVDGLPDLADIIDEVGDETPMDVQSEYARTEAWVYVDGEVSVGTDHYAAALSNANVHDPDELRCVTTARTGGKWVSHQLAFGHGANGAAVVELDCLTADLDDVVQALKQAGYAKVYTVPFWEDCTVTRVARRRLTRRALALGDLTNVDDQLGDEQVLDERPELTRSDAWVYLDGLVTRGLEHTAAVRAQPAVHTQLAQGDRTLYEAINNARTDGQLPGHALAFGHGARGVAVVELDCLSAELAKVIKALKEAGYIKVHTVLFWKDCVVTRTAQTEQSSVRTREQSLALIRGSDWSAYADLQPIGRDGLGVEAFHLVQKAGEGVARPIVYFAEVWPFRVPGQSDTDCLLLAWRYTAGGVLTDDGCVTLFKRINHRRLTAAIKAGETRLADGNLVWFGGDAYTDAQMVTNNVVE